MEREWSWGTGGTRVWFTSSGIQQQRLKNPTTTALGTHKIPHSPIGNVKRKGSHFAYNKGGNGLC